MSSFNKDCIYRHWIHSHEEDTKDKKIYRPSNFKFPPARGRDGFAIKENGNFILYGIGATDKREEIHGSFKFDSNNLHIDLTSTMQKSYTMTIISCDENQLVIKKN
jgi:hypothetical protein